MTQGPVDDFGLEVLRKSAEAFGNNSYSLRVINTDDQRSAFGANHVYQKKPYAFINATYGLPERITETFTSGTGSAAGMNDNSPGVEMVATSGTTQGGYGVIRSKKVMSYRPGVGSCVLYTARFSTPAANSFMRAGLQNIGNELAFGYDGTTFGIYYRTGGRPEIRAFTITVAAGGAETVTITLNSVPFNVSVTNSSAAQNAYEIAQGTFTGWTAYSIGSKVYFQAKSTGAKTGTYSVASTGTLTGTYARTFAGLTEQETWIPQTSWNVSTLTESDTNSFVLNPQKGNVFKIQYQYLGYGCIFFYAENPENGRFILVHKIKYANSYTTPSMDLPQFKCGLIAANTTGTTSISVYSGSMAMFHENALEYPQKVHSAIKSVASVGTSLTNIIALKKTTIILDRLNICDIVINNLSVACEGTKPVEFEVRLNPTFTTPRLWEAVDEDSGITVTNTGGAVTGGEVLFAGALGKSSSESFDVSNFDIFLSNDDVISICAKAGGATSDITASMSFAEA